MPRSASSVATAVMNRCVIPAPAPCASTKQARALLGVCNKPETRKASSIVIVIGTTFEDDMHRLPKQQKAWWRCSRHAYKVQACGMLEHFSNGLLGMTLRYPF